MKKLPDKSEIRVKVLSELAKYISPKGKIWKRNHVTIGYFCEGVVLKGNTHGY